MDHGSEQYLYFDKWHANLGVKIQFKVSLLEIELSIHYLNIFNQFPVISENFLNILVEK